MKQTLGLVVLCAAVGLTVDAAAAAPVIDTPPQEQISTPGGSATFSVVASGPGLTYQWYHDGESIAGATSANLTLSNLDWRDAGLYTVRVANNDGAVISAPVRLRGPNAAPVVTTQPGISDVIAGATATLTVAATGTGPLAFHWRNAGSEVPGATTATLTLANTTMRDAGWYDAVVVDGLSTTASHAGRVFVRPPRYGDRMRVVTTFAPSFENDGGTVTRVAVNADGSFYLAGEFTSIAGLTRVGLARFHADGTPDTSFNPPTIDDGISPIAALAPLASGKIIIGGGFTRVGGVARGGIVRLNADGSLDLNFNPGEGFRWGSDPGEVLTLLVQPDGRILAGGNFHTCDAVARPFLARLHADGSVDTTFATGSGANYAVRALARRSDGRIFVGGDFTTFNGVERHGVVRLLPDGALDSNFSTRVEFALGVDSLAVQADGRVLVSGSFRVDKDLWRGGPFRLNHDGAIDTSFPMVDRLGTVHSLIVLADDSIIAGGGFTDFDGVARGGIARFHGDGSLDAAFVSAPGFSDEGNKPNIAAIGRQPDGRLVVVGRFTTYQGNPRRNVARLEANGALEPTFAPPTRTRAEVHTVAAAGNGAWVVGGDFAFVNGIARDRVARIHADGSLDSGFALTAGYYVNVDEVTVARDGSVYAIGHYSDVGGGRHPRFARFAADGELDENYLLAVAERQTVSTAELRPDGRLWVGGSFDPGSIARLMPSGETDPTFVAGSGFQGSVRTLLPTADGGVIAGGAFSEYNGTPRGSFARLTVDGALDPNFGPGSGIFHTNAISSGSGYVQDGAMLPDGRFLLSGSWDSFNGSPAPDLLRFNPSGTPDTSFLADSSAYNSTLLPQGDGRVVLTAVNPSGSGNHLARLTATGSIDPTFSVTPWREQLLVRDLAFRDDGRILVASGWAGSYIRFTAPGLMLLEPAAPAPPVIIVAPQSQSTAAGRATTLTVRAWAISTITYQWQRLAPGNGSLNAPPTADTWVDIAGATSAAYAIPCTQSFHCGSYRVAVTADGLSTVCDPVDVSVTAPAYANARLLNISTRGLAQAGDNVLIPGFVISGTGSKRLLIRAVGPTLSHDPYRVAGVLADPRLTLKRLNTEVQPPRYDDVTNNDNWRTNANADAITQTAADLFAFALEDDREAALLLDLPPGQYTVVADGVSAATGVAIVELYDADGGTPGSRLINISNRGFCGVGDQVMIPGFVVSSEGPKTLLVRVVGPTLAGAPYNVPGTMTDPKLEVFPGGESTPILTNDNWGDNPDAAFTAQIAEQVSAFPLTAGSKDAAFVVTLPPGSYTVVGSSAVANGTGVVLVEVYVVP